METLENALKYKDRLEGLVDALKSTGIEPRVIIVHPTGMDLLKLYQWSLGNPLATLKTWNQIPVYSSNDIEGDLKEIAVY